MLEDRLTSYRLARHLTQLSHKASGFAIDAIAMSDDNPDAIGDRQFAGLALRALRLRVEGIGEWIENPVRSRGEYVAYGRAAPAVDRIMEAMADRNRAGMVDAPADDVLVSVKVGDIRALLNAMVGSRK